MNEKHERQEERKKVSQRSKALQWQKSIKEKSFCYGRKESKNGNASCLTHRLCFFLLSLLSSRKHFRFSSFDFLKKIFNFYSKKFAVLPKKDTKKIFEEKRSKFRRILLALAWSNVSKLIKNAYWWIASLWSRVLPHHFHLHNLARVL